VKYSMVNINVNKGSFPLFLPSLLSNRGGCLSSVPFPFYPLIKLLDSGVVFSFFLSLQSRLSIGYLFFFPLRS